jgi:hypothetical protein
MNERRVRVLEIAAEGAGFELDAELDERGVALAFFTSTGGPHGFEEPFGEKPEPRVAQGPLTWSEVLETWLRPHEWLNHSPRVVHPSIANLVQQELTHATDDARARWSPIVRAATFRASILRAYARPNRIHPFIGETFAGGDPGSLRVMTIGINAYLSDADWTGQHPEWFAGWFRDETHKFDRTVAADASTVARALADRSPNFAGLAFDGKANIFHTNAVKEYLPAAEGKQSDQLTRAHFEAHVATWHAELDVMAQHGVLPHVVIVFGRPFWEAAWQTFGPKTKPVFEHLAVHGFVNTPGEGHDHANLLEVEGSAGKHTLALLGLRHPAARATSKATPEWLLSRNDVRELLSLRLA